MHVSKILIAIACGTLTFGATGIAGAVEPEEQPDGSWITLSGTVAAPDEDSFLLEYDEGVITVEMDDWDDEGEAQGLLDGDNVTVYGRVDDDTFETTTIEASSVYVESLNTHFYASAVDEEDHVDAWVTTAPIDVGTTNIQGLVTSVDHAEGEFTVDSGTRQVLVDIDGLGYNPLDEHGFQEIEIGDRVSVHGDLDLDLFERRELVADSVITLDDADA